MFLTNIQLENGDNFWKANISLDYYKKKRWKIRRQKFNKNWESSVIRTTKSGTRGKYQNIQHSLFSVVKISLQFCVENFFWVDLFLQLADLCIFGLQLSLQLLHEILFLFNFFFQLTDLKQSLHNTFRSKLF